MHKIIFSLFIVSFSLAQNSVVRQFSKAFADVAEKAKPAVVTIITDRINFLFLQASRTLVVPKRFVAIVLIGFL